MNLFRGGEIWTSHTKSSGCDLLDRAVPVRKETLLRFAALAGVALSAELVHRERYALVRFLADGAVAHSARLKAADDLFHRLDFLNRNRLAFRKAQQVAQRNGRVAFHVLDVFFKQGIIARAHRCLQEVDRLRVIEVVLAVLFVLESSAGGQLVDRRGQHLFVVPQNLALEVFQRHTADAGDRAGKEAVDQLLRKPQCLENLRVVVAVHAGDAHLAHHFEYAVVVAVVNVFHRFFQRNAFEMPFVIERFDRLVDAAQMDALRAVAYEASDVVHFSGLIAVHDQRAAAAQAFSNQMMMYARGCEERRNRNQRLARLAVGEHEDRIPTANRLLRRGKQRIQTCFQTQSGIKHHIELRRAKAGDAGKQAL